MSYLQTWVTWLEDPAAIRGLLVEVEVYNINTGLNTTLYLSTMGYVTTSGDAMFNPILNNSIQISESIDIQGDSVGISYGDLEITNTSGEFDDWLDNTKYIWVNKNISIYHGDPRWVCLNMASVRTTFQLIFKGIVADIDSKDRISINIKLRDKLERLNAPITENKLGNTGVWAGGTQEVPSYPNKDSIKPLVFGEVFNVEPLLTDPSTFTYMFNDGPAELLIEIRDNGVPLYTHNGNAVILNADIPNTISEGTGTFILSRPLAGTCTVSIQGVKKSINLSNGSLVTGTYVNNVANLIALIVTQYGKEATRFTAADLDLDNLSTFQSNNQQKVGIIINDRENVLDVCKRLANSIGAQLYINRFGKLQLLKIGASTDDTSVSITDDDIILSTLSISNKLAVTAATSIGFCKNWTVQTGLLTGIPEDHKLIFSSEWPDPKITTDGDVKLKYTLDALPVQKDTLLIAESDALQESQRLNNYYKLPKTVYKFTGISRLMSLKLGQPVTLTHNRFNLSSKSGQVISLNPNWLNGTIEVEVIA